MSSPQDAQRLLRELCTWLEEMSADYDDAVPALLILGARIAAAKDKSLEMTVDIVTAAYNEAIEQRKILQARH